MTKPNQGWAARQGHSHGQFRQGQHPGQVEQADNEGGDQHGDRPVIFQAQVPAEVGAGNHDAHAQRPDVEDPQRFLQGMVLEVGPFLRPQLLQMQMSLGRHLLDDRIQVHCSRRSWIITHCLPFSALETQEPMVITLTPSRGASKPFAESLS
jgi:hypothetical protein